jgi:hypothetical protein
MGQIPESPGHAAVIWRGTWVIRVVVGGAAETLCHGSILFTVDSDGKMGGRDFSMMSPALPELFPLYRCHGGWVCCPKGPRDSENCVTAVAEMRRARPMAG